MFTWSVLSFFGLIFAFRTHETLRSIHLMRQNSSFSLIATLIFTIFASVLLRNYVVLQIFFDLSLLIAAPMIVWLENQRINRDLFAHIVSIVDVTLVRMSAGSSFREAFGHSLDIQSRRLKRLLQDFHLTLTYEKTFTSYQLNKKSMQMLSELKEVDCESYRQIERLRALRKKWRIEQDFRRKSSAALLQVRVQSQVMLGIYLLLIAFMTHQFEWKSVQNSFFVSLPIFGTGFGWISSLGRKYKWKI